MKSRLWRTHFYSPVYTFPYDKIFFCKTANFIPSHRPSYLIYRYKQRSSSLSMSPLLNASKRLFIQHLTFCISISSSFFFVPATLFETMSSCSERGQKSFVPNQSRLSVGSLRHPGDLKEEEWRNATHAGTQQIRLSSNQAFVGAQTNLDVKKLKPQCVTGQKCM